MPYFLPFLIYSDCNSPLIFICLFILYFFYEKIVKKSGVVFQLKVRIKTISFKIVKQICANSVAYNIIHKGVIFPFLKVLVAFNYAKKPLIKLFAVMFYYYFPNFRKLPQKKFPSCLMFVVTFENTKLVFNSMTEWHMTNIM